MLMNASGVDFNLTCATSRPFGKRIRKGTTTWCSRCLPLHGLCGWTGWLCEPFPRPTSCPKPAVREAGPQFLQRASAGDGLGQAVGQFIELVAHKFPFGFAFRRFFVFFAFFVVKTPPFHPCPSSASVLKHPLNSSFASAAKNSPSQTSIANAAPDANAV